MGVSRGMIESQGLTSAPVSGVLGVGPSVEPNRTDVREVFSETDTSLGGSSA